MAAVAMVTTNASSGLPERAAVQLRELWTRVQLRGGRDVTREDLHGIARDVGAAAWAASLPAEYLVIAIKESWRGVAGFIEREARRETLWVLTELISLSIQEYYLAGRLAASDLAAPPALRPDGAGPHARPGHGAEP